MGETSAAAGHAPRRTAGRAIVEQLVAEGVDAVYGLPGGHVLSIYDALYDTPQIRHVLVRHEQTAACMAAAHAQLTGRPGVCVVTAGPGATNLLTGIAEAHVGCLPVVVFAGRGATTTAHRGASQEVATDRVFAPVTKWTVRVDRAEAVPELVRQAFAVATSGRPGPVLVDLPRDVLDTEIDADPRPRAAGRPPRLRPDQAPVQAAAAALAAAQRPLIVAGGGVLAAGASGRVQRLAERLASPVLTSLAGRGSLPEDHPLAAGGLGAHRTRLSKRLLAEADVVLGLATRFEEMETNWRPDALPAPTATYIQVDIEAAEIGRSIRADIAVVGDVGEVVGDLCTALGPAPARDELTTLPHVAALAEELAALEAEAVELAAGEAVPMHPLAPITAVAAALPREATLGFDVGCLAQHIAGGMPYTRVLSPRSTIVPSSFYGMGFVASALPAARVVHPDRPAVAFVGDGSMAMVMSVLPAAAEQRLGVTWCVLDDGALGSIRDIQQYRFGERYLATDLPLELDLGAVARACGCHGERVSDPADVEPAITRALAANAEGVPALLDFVVARERLLGSLEHYSFYPADLTAAAVRA
jgi:acetolactate synthase I/II/III large subunit